MDLRPIPLSHPDSFIALGDQDHVLMMQPGDEQGQIIAAGPIVKQDKATAPMRVVLRHMTDDTWVIHFQNFPRLKLDGFDRRTMFGGSDFHEGSYPQENFALAIKL